jgi:glycosyltransferase involved in cell wall biosynthesis
MLIGVNLLGLAPATGGEEIYLRQVLRRAGELPTATKFVLFTDSGNHEQFSGFERLPYQGREQVAREASGRVAAAMAEKAGVDALFTSLAAQPGRTKVATVYYALDLLPWEQMPAKRGWFAGNPLKKTTEACMAATAVVAPSEYLKKRLLELLEIPLDKVVVAPLGVDEVFSQPQRCVVEKPYVLVVGATRAYKNIPRLMQAYRKIRQEFVHTLVVVGPPGDAEVADWGPHIVRIDRVPVATLAGLYQHAELFVSPVLYEGSGVTVLEAMKSGVPVVAGRVGAIPEIAGNVPIYCNVEDIGSLVAAIRRGLQEQGSDRETRVRQGRQLADRFKWKDCAWKTLSAFKRV